MARQTATTTGASDPNAPRGKAASAGLQKRLKTKDTTEAYQPNETERVVQKYVNGRVSDMIDFRKGLGLEQRWREADEEYIPHELDFGTTRKRFETDQDSGLRSRMVPVGDATQQWRNAASAPTLLAKIQTAVSIIIDQQPEAELVALLKKYSATTELAYALWKRNWQISDAKEKLKIVVFDLIKYGWKPQRTYPRKVQYDKNVLTYIDAENPDNNRFEAKNLVWYNDIDRQPLNVYKTWIDELATPYDPYSRNEVYFELDFSYDAAEIEYGMYGNFQYVKRDSFFERTDAPKKNNRNEMDKQQRKRKDVVTMGFFESRHKDLYVIKAVKDDIVIYMGPLPNDDGYISVTDTFWIMRKSDSPYGISLWEIIRQDKQLYDKMKNMTMDQLVLSIMKFGFFTGTNPAVSDGMIQIVPGQARQLTTSSGSAKDAVSWMEIPGPGKDSWTGLEYQSKEMDTNSGIVPTLEGEVTGKTLGEILHAKEAALKRIKVPVENIAWLVEQDAYLTLSWMSQVYATPTVEEFASISDVQDFNKENQINHMQLFGTVQKDGTIAAPFEAHYLPQLALHLEDSEGQLVKSKDSKFYQVGTDIKPNQLRWQGIFKVLPRSIVDASQTLIKAMKMEIFNMLVPLLGQPKELAAKPAAQILKVNEEDPADWLPDDWIDFLKNGPQPPQPPAPGTPGTPGGAPPTPGAPGAPNTGAAPAGAPPGAPQPPGLPPTSPLTPSGPTIQGMSGQTPPQAATIVPGSQMPNIASMMGGKPGQLFKKGA